MTLFIFGTKAFSKRKKLGFLLVRTVVRVVAVTADFLALTKQCWDIVPINAVVVIATSFKCFGVQIRPRFMG